MTEWCEMSETILANDSSEQLVSSSGEVNGPRTELEHWRTYATPPGPPTLRRRPICSCASSPLDEQIRPLVTSPSCTAEPP